MPMDICSHLGLSATRNVNNHHGLCKNTPRSTHGVLKSLSVDELSVDVTKFLNIQDAIEEDSSFSTPLKDCEFQKQDSCDKFLQSKESHQDVLTSELSTHGDNIESDDPSAFCSISLPSHLKPVSAMKGSREKRGVTPPVKLTVKWAPDVYDPIPTSVSHFVTNNRSSSSKHSSKKNSKHKQKHGSKSSSSSASSRGSKSKDKKQVRKRSSSSSSSGMSYKFEEFADDFHDEAGGIDFHDRLCGSSFIKGYGTRIHISSLAEAT